MYDTVAYELEINLHTVTFHARLQTWRNGINDLVDLILNTYHEGRRGRPPQAHVWPSISPRPHPLPDNLLRFDLDIATHTAAMMYTAHHPHHHGTWISHSSENNPHPWLSWDDDLGDDGRYPPTAAIPLELIRPALHQLHTTAGDRPTCTTWKRLPHTIW